MQNDLQANSAIDAIRCVYLARTAREKGREEAARRWQQMATSWLKTLEPRADVRENLESR